MCLRKGIKHTTAEREVRGKSLRNSLTDTEVRKEGEEGGAPGAIEETFLKSLEETTVEQALSCSLWRRKVGIP